MRMAQRHSFGTSRKWLLHWKSIQSYQELSFGNSAIEENFSHSRSWRLGGEWDEPTRSWSFGGFENRGRHDQVHHYSLQYTIAFGHALSYDHHPRFHDPAMYVSVIRETPTNDPVKIMSDIKVLEDRIESLEKIISKLPAWLLESVS